jgi:hypothetical protein
VNGVFASDGENRGSSPWGQQQGLQLPVPPVLPHAFMTSIRQECSLGIASRELQRSGFFLMSEPERTTSLFALSISLPRSRCRCVGEHLVNSLAAENELIGERVTLAKIESVLPEVVGVLRRPIAPLPLNAVVLATATRLAADPASFTLGEIRHQLLNLFANNTALARLSGGSRGPNEQFVSINVKAIGRHHAVR